MSPLRRVAAVVVAPAVAKLRDQYQSPPNIGTAFVCRYGPVILLSPMNSMQLPEESGRLIALFLSNTEVILREAWC
jgi:hypothetical protein